ncbi:MAG TPA: uroporphyrinogen-III synthase [Methylomirabilota bacterium]|nr:uroporphyrinogen-III synthase [Methylomirabilota bacterium]
MTPRALAGRTVVVTRAADQASGFVELLEGAGARVLEAPTIAIEPPVSWGPLDRALDELATFTWAVFTSVNGVAMVGRRLEERGLDWSGFARLRVAAIGPATAEALIERGLRPAAVPEEYRAEALAQRLRSHIGAEDRVLLARAAQAREVLARELAALGAAVVEVPAYTTRRVEVGTGPLREALAARTVDVVTFTSSSTARNFAELFTVEERQAWLDGVTIACIGPITAATAAEYGLPTHVMPRQYTIAALAGAIDEHFARARRPSGSEPRADRRSQ